MTGRGWFDFDRPGWTLLDARMRLVGGPLRDHVGVMVGLSIAVQGAMCAFIYVSASPSDQSLYWSMFRSCFSLLFLSCYGGSAVQYIIGGGWKLLELSGRTKTLFRGTYGHGILCGLLPIAAGMPCGLLLARSTAEAARILWMDFGAIGFSAAVAAWLTRSAEPGPGKRTNPLRSVVRLVLPFGVAGACVYFVEPQRLWYWFHGVYELCISLGPFLFVGGASAFTWVTHRTEHRFEKSYRSMDEWLFADEQIEPRSVPPGKASRKSRRFVSSRPVEELIRREMSCKIIRSTAVGVALLTVAISLISSTIGGAGSLSAAGPLYDRLFSGVVGFGLALFGFVAGTVTLQSLSKLRGEILADLIITMGVSPIVNQAFVGSARASLPILLATVGVASVGWGWFGFDTWLPCVTGTSLALASVVATFAGCGALMRWPAKDDLPGGLFVLSIVTAPVWLPILPWWLRDSYAAAEENPGLFETERGARPATVPTF